MAEHNQRFETFEEWVNKASSWLTRHPQFDGKDFRAICFDSKGRICRMGGDFMRAEFPVYWVWPDQNLFETVDTARKSEITHEMMEAGQDYLNRIAFGGLHILPAQFRWVEFWEAVQNAKPPENAP